MRALVQRVTQATVRVEEEVTGTIQQGLVVFLGIHASDTAEQAATLAEKIAQMRIFGNETGRFDRCALDIAASVLVVSQFTLYADVRKGRRPSFTAAAPPEIADPLVTAFCQALRARGLVVATGVFGAHMTVELINDGPVTIWLDSQDLARPRRAHNMPVPGTDWAIGPENS